jgi:hypothetical protein
LERGRIKVREKASGAEEYSCGFETEIEVESESVKHMS